MGFFSFLKTSDKAVDTVSNVIDAGVKGIDALFFTNEEKSQASMKVTQLWIKMQEAMANENSAKSITRRYLAFGFCGEHIFLGLLMIGVWPWFPKYSAYILEFIKTQTSIILAIVIFYFGYWGVQQIIDKVKK